MIRGSAVNQDGRSTLLDGAKRSGPRGTDSRGRWQLRSGAPADWVRRGAWYGTALGDPIEVEAIVETIGEAAKGSGSCLLGSAKANLGHLEAAAGVDRPDKDGAYIAA